MSSKDLTHVSKFLSYVLRHHPESIGLDISDSGWVETEKLIQKANQTDIDLNFPRLTNIVRNSSKKRFAFNHDKSKIRANYGHSIDVDLDLVSQSPPEKLFHGTADRFLDSIKKQGLTPQNRNFVHLSINKTAAQKIGQRHGDPVILEINSYHMDRKGWRFYTSGKDIWLVKKVQPKFIENL